MSEQALNFESRAKRLRTKQQVAQQEEKAKALDNKGCTRDDYWKKHVHCKEDVEMYYKIFYPAYPEELCKAIALRLESLKRDGFDSKEEQNKFMRKYDKSGKEVKDPSLWDYQEEVNAQKLAGQINLAAKRLADLLQEEQQ